MAPALVGAWWQRAAMSQLMIDESTAVGAAQHERRWRRYGYLVAGVGVFVVWNLTTMLGHVAFADAGDLITDLGLDAAGPAAFLALLWPRLSSEPQRRTAIAGAADRAGAHPVRAAGRADPRFDARRVRRARVRWRNSEGHRSTRSGSERRTIVLIVMTVGTFALKSAGPLVLGDRRCRCGAARGRSPAGRAPRCPGDRVDRR
jgi:hypothetical protein